MLAGADPAQAERLMELAQADIDGRWRCINRWLAWRCKPLGCLEENHVALIYRRAIRPPTANAPGRLCWPND